jgi:multiple sugar transport system substrate-binding protein
MLRIAGSAAAVGLLAACGGTGAATTAATSAAATTAAASAPSTTAAAAAATSSGPAAPANPTPKAGAVQVVMHSWLEDPNDTFWGPEIQKFEQANPNIQIIRQWFPRSDMHTKELALAATGQIGDLVRINVAPLCAELQAKNVLQPLDTFINQDSAWKTNDQPQFWPANIATYTIQGKQWGYPMVGHPGCVQYYINLDMADKLGIKAPDASTGFKWTMDDATQMFQKFTQKGADGRVSVYGILSCLGGEGTVGVLRGFGGNYYSADGKKVLINSKESIDGLTWLSDLFNKYKVEEPLQANPDPTQLFPNQSLAVFVSTSFQASNMLNLVGSKFKFTVVPPPIGPTGKFATQVSSDGIGMSKISKHPNEAWTFMKFLVSQQFGLGRFLAGLGSPGSRNDVWTAPEFKQKVPTLADNIYPTLINPPNGDSPLLPWYYPANARYNQADTAMTNILQNLWLGKTTPTDAANQAQQQVQPILDQPVP